MLGRVTDPTAGMLSSNLRGSWRATLAPDPMEHVTRSACNAGPTPWVRVMPGDRGLGGSKLGALLEKSGFNRAPGASGRRAERPPGGDPQRHPIPRGRLWAGLVDALGTEDSGEFQSGGPDVDSTARKR